MKTKNERKKVAKKKLSERAFCGVFWALLAIFMVIAQSGCVSHVAWTAGGGKDGVEKAGQMVIRRGQGVDHPYGAEDLEIDNRVKVGKRSAQKD